MTTTGPMPVVRVDQSEERLALLDSMGARQADRFVRYRFPTADAIVDLVRDALFIVCDPDPDPDDWEAICGLIAKVGFDNGTWPHYQDPGEPETDPMSGVCVWRLEYVQPCVWCDGRGVTGGCPLCTRER